MEISLNKTVNCLRRNWPKYLIGLFALMLLISVIIWGTRRTVSKENKRDETRELILSCIAPGPNPPPITGNKCYDEGTRRSAEAITQLRKSLDCTALWELNALRREFGLDEEPLPQCADVIARIEALRGPPSPPS